VARIEITSYTCEQKKKERRVVPNSVVPLIFCVAISVLPINCCNHRVYCRRNTCLGLRSHHLGCGSWTTFSELVDVWKTLKCLFWKGNKKHSKCIN